MPPLSNSSIRDSIRLLKSRNIYFYHACQLQDLDSYIKLGGIPTRKLLQDSGSQFTRFDTDKQDVRSGVWDMVFGNLSDYGRAFAADKWPKERAWTPNPYGPIVLIANPEIFLEADDLAICVRSASSKNFDRVSESISTPQELNEIFEHPVECEDQRKRSHFRGFRPEVSCKVSGGVLRFNRLTKVVVDSYGNSGSQLWIEACSYCSGMGCAVERRYYKDERQKILGDLENIFLERIPLLHELETMESVYSQTRDWAHRIRLSQLDYQYDRFGRYLREGTLLQLLGSG